MDTTSLNKDRALHVHETAANTKPVASKLLEDQSPIVNRGMVDLPRNMDSDDDSDADAFLYLPVYRPKVADQSKDIILKNQQKHSEDEACYDSVIEILDDTLDEDGHVAFALECAAADVSRASLDGDADFAKDVEEKHFGVGGCRDTNEAKATLATKQRQEDDDCIILLSSDDEADIPCKTSNTSRVAAARLKDMSDSEDDLPSPAPSVQTENSTEGRSGERKAKEIRSCLQLRLDWNHSVYRIFEAIAEWDTQG